MHQAGREARWGDGGPSLGQVSGSVTYKGQPLSQGEISFFPTNGRPAFGKIVDGKIVEATFVATNDGVPVGTHQVSIQSMTNADDMYAEQKSLIPKRYGDPATSGLTAEVQKGQNDLSFELVD